MVFCISFFGWQQIIDKEKNMTLFELLDMYDNYNMTMVVNDNYLNPIIKNTVVNVISSKKYAILLNAEVVSFGFYDDELCVRIK